MLPEEDLKIIKKKNWGESHPGRTGLLFKLMERTLFLPLKCSSPENFYQ